MSRNGSGNYSLPEAPFVYNTVISETAMNSNLSDIAAALTGSLAKDGQTTPTDNLPMGSYKHTGANTGSGGSSGEYLSRDYWLTQRLRGNVIVNPSGEIDQMGTTSTGDDTYGGPDAWYTLVQTAAVSASQGTNGEDGTPFFQRLTQSQASSQRMGRAQIIESSFCRHLRGQSAVMQARVRLSSTATLRYAVLEWTGTADSVTSEIVNDWTSSTYTAGNFFASTTLSVLAVGSVALTADTWASITELDVSVGSSMNNLIVFFWTEAVAAQNVTLDVSRVKLALGSDATPFEPRLDELSLCQRYLPFYMDATSNSGMRIAWGRAYTTSNADVILYLPVTPRVTPTIVVDAASNFRLENGSASGVALTAIATPAMASGPSGVAISFGVSSSAGFTAKEVGAFRPDGTNGVITIHARL